ncbi:hypothetical protein [Ignavibacterium sp.]|nr:hypothetical protein [Ignavibacterium sp.]
MTRIFNQKFLKIILARFYSLSLSLSLLGGAEMDRVCNSEQHRAL